jgi:TonB family protein
MRLVAIGLVLLWASTVPAQLSASGRKIVSKSDPRYPDLARSMRLQGTVKLSVLVGPNGSVKSIEALGGSPLLVKASQDAVSKWKWAPATQETTERIELRFSPD